MPQQGHPVGIDVTHHHLQGGIGGHQLTQLLQEGRSEGGAGRMHQHRRHQLAAAAHTAFQQEGVGGGAPLQAVLHFKAQSLGAEAPQADQAGLDLQADHLALNGSRCLGRGGGGDGSGHQ